MGCTASVGKAKIIRNESERIKKSNKLVKRTPRKLKECEKTMDCIPHLSVKELFKICEVDPCLEESGQIQFSCRFDLPGNSEIEKTKNLTNQ
ncbi:unnamed protein product [Blepharisma stoltei]|uniref:Uncharacterized protein n=1 Tax=Blepharisma stoltei TaxID=1481888 RepID=A0AAU9J2T0_9CILI|nr:unnamed protein product [Blepharisma stoltei]